jgi:hypothetical protein
MRPTRIAVLVAMVAALMAAVAPVATAKVGLAGGTTTLKLDRGTAGALADAGVAVRPLAPAKARGGAVAFPVVGGRIDPATAAGRIDHRGGLVFKKGRQRVALRSFRVHVGTRRAILTAAAGDSRLTVLSLSLKRAKVVRKGLATTVRGVRATLTADAAKALNAAFSTGLFARGTPIGAVTVRARPAQLELAGGATTLALDAGAAGALQSLGVAASPIDPATASGAGLRFPVSGGRLAVDGFAGEVRHSGGIRLAKGGTAVDLTDFAIRVDDAPDLTANVGGQRVSILSLDLSGLEARTSGRRVVLSGVRASLTREAADALNAAFATTAFAEGLVLGTATVDGRAR